jgi:hypothetical protein
MSFMGCARVDLQASTWNQWHTTSEASFFSLTLNKFHYKFPYSTILHISFVPHCAQLIKNFAFVSSMDIYISHFGIEIL